MNIYPRIHHDFLAYCADRLSANWFSHHASQYYTIKIYISAPPKEKQSSYSIPQRPINSAALPLGYSESTKIWGDMIPYAEENQEPVNCLVTNVGFEEF